MNELEHNSLTPGSLPAQKLGAVALSPDILAKANIGLWAFELDEGLPPRMFADGTMLGLLGLDHPIPPEEIYHAWYDRIDKASYGLVTDAVEQMSSGEHAEVQYPWHHPDGHTMIVRCGGVRNPEYTKGVRIEGTHQDVTEVLHFDEEETKLARNLEIELVKSNLRADALDFVMGNDPDPEKFMAFFGKRILEISGADQVIFRTLDGHRNVFNAPGIEDIPEEICSHCIFSEYTSSAFGDNGVVLMNDCSLGYNGLQVHPNCPAKSSVMQQVFSNGKLVGLLTVHYLKNPHTFTEYGLDILKTVAAYLGLLLSRIRASSQLEALRKEKERNLIEPFLANYTTVYLVHPDDTYETVKRNPIRLAAEKSYPLFNDRILDFTNRFVYEADRDEMFRVMAPERIRGQREGTTCSFEFRVVRNGVPTWNEVTVTSYINGDILVGFMAKDAEISLRRLSATLNVEYDTIFSVYLSENKGKILKLAADSFQPRAQARVFDFDVSIRQAAATVDSDYADEISALADPEHLKELLKEQDRYELFYTAHKIRPDSPWTNLSIHALERSNGEPSVLLFAFKKLDDYEVREVELKNEITRQQKQLQEALSMAQSANRAKTTFLNNMSHDIRTPMNAIIGYTELAESHLDNKEQVRDYLGKISQSSDHLLSLINDVLDMSRIESGKMNLEEKEENLSDIIHTLRDIVQADIHSKQLRFSVDAVDINDEDVICDKLRLNQVLLNVLSNAIKYTPAGGTVSLRITEKAVKKTGYGTYEFCIRDNGIGMTKEFAETIFDPFTRMQSSTVSGIQGTGLGMAISKNIVDMMGGRIHVESEPDRGTEVTILLDFRLRSEPIVPEVLPELAGVRGLVVDDDTNTCLSVANMLRNIGMRPEWCTSGRETLLRAGEGCRIGDAFRIYIIDWMLPDMNGLEVARRLRKTVGADAPIIIVTAYDWTALEEEAAEAGVTAFVSKPVFPSDLHRALRSCFGKAEPPAETAAPEYDFTGRRVLLVEDNELNREIATELLEDFGFSVDTAEDGDIAVGIIKSAADGAYDLILMDIQMPRMDGYEATRQIRALGTDLSRIPILAMTANAFEEDRRQALDAGMNAHIAKPIDVNMLKETLAEFL